MLANTFADNAKVMAKGQVTLPKDIRKVFGVASGDRITFIVEGNTIRIVNFAVYAMQVLQKEMSKEAEHTGLLSDDDMALVKAASYSNHGLICEQNVDETKRIFNKKFLMRLASFRLFYNKISIGHTYAYCWW